MSFSSIQDFRSRATNEDMAALEAFIAMQQKKAEAFPNETYNFSYTSAATYLRSKGYLGDTRKQAPAAKKTPEFSISNLGERGNFTNRSFSVRDTTLERFDKLCKDYWQYSKKAVFDKLFDEALRKYGY